MTESGKTSRRPVVFIPGSQNSRGKSPRCGRAWERRFLEGIQQERQSVGSEGPKSMLCVLRAMGSHGGLQTRQSQGLRWSLGRMSWDRRGVAVGMVQVGKGEV